MFFIVLFEPTPGREQLSLKKIVRQVLFRRNHLNGCLVSPTPNPSCFVNCPSASLHSVGILTKIVTFHSQCNAMQCNAMQCNAIQSNPFTIQSNPIQYFIDTPLVELFNNSMLKKNLQIHF